MSAKLNPYLGFRDTARQAMEFYQSVFGGELSINTFGDFGASPDPAEADKVMHAQLITPSGFTLMASDAPNSMEIDEGSTIQISISGDSAEELTGYWEKLSAEGKVTMPLDKQAWGDVFGMCTDRFGTNWMIDILPA